MARSQDEIIAEYKQKIHELAADYKTNPNNHTDIHNEVFGLIEDECFTPYTNRITLIRDYILELEEKNNIKTDLIGDLYETLDKERIKRSRI